MADIKKVKTLGPLPTGISLDMPDEPEVDPRMPYIIHEGEEQEVRPIEDYQMPDRVESGLLPDEPEPEFPNGLLPEPPMLPKEDPEIAIELPEPPMEPLPPEDETELPLPKEEPKIDIEIPNDPGLNGPNWQDKNKPHIMLPYERFIPGKRVESPTPVPMTAYDAPGETPRSTDAIYMHDVSMKEALSEATVSAREAASSEDKSLVESINRTHGYDSVKGGVIVHKSETKGKAQERGNESWIADIVKQGRQSAEQSLEGLE